MPTSIGLESLASFLAGLAFFFMGLDLIRRSFVGLASYKARQRSVRLLSDPFRAAAFGFGVGAISQSAAAVALILSGLVPAGLVTMRRSLNVVAWANVGTAVLPFVVAIDVRLGGLWLIGLAGLAARNRRLSGRRSAFEVLLGIGILLFGLALLRAATAPLTSEDWFVSLLGVVQASLLVGWLVGAALVLIFQSSGAVVVIIIVLTSHGQVDANHALAVVCGTGFGTAVNVRLLGRGLRGLPARVTWWQAILNFGSAGIVAAWAVLGEVGLIPSLADLLGQTGMRFETQLAMGFLVQRLLCVVVAFILAPRAPALLERLAPEPPEDELSRMRFLGDPALETPEIAVDLARMEQLGVLAATPSLLDEARTDATERHGLDREALLRSLRTLDSEIGGFLRLLIERSGPGGDSVRMIHANGRQEALSDFVDALARLGDEVRRLEPGSRARDIGGMLADSTDLLIHALVDAFRTGSREDCDAVIALTDSRSARMDRLRALAAGDQAGPADHAALLYATSLFERLSFLARRMVDRLPDDVVPDAPPLPMPPVLAARAPEPEPDPAELLLRTRE